MSWTAVLIVTTFIPAALFPLVYGFGFPWWRSLVGRSVLNLSTVIALTLSLSVWAYFVGRPPPEFRIVAFLLIDVALWIQLIVLLLSPRANRRRRRTEPKEDTNVPA